MTTCGFRRDVRRRREGEESVHCQSWSEGSRTRVHHRSFRSAAGRFLLALAGIVLSFRSRSSRLVFFTVSSCTPFWLHAFLFPSLFFLSACFSIFSCALCSARASSSSSFFFCSAFSRAILSRRRCSCSPCVNYFAGALPGVLFVSLGSR